MPEVDLIRAVCAHFDIGRVVQVEELMAGLMNRNWAARTSEGRFAVKHVLDIDETRALRQHRVTRAMAADELPVPAPLSARDGLSLVKIDGGLFAVLPWVDGRHRHGTDLALDECRTLGRLLATVHGWLAANASRLDLDTPPDARLIRPTDPERAAARIEQFIDLVRANPDQDDFDDVVIERLVERQRILADSRHLRPTEELVSPVGWTHGDWHDLNILWSATRPDEVAGVLDWDRLRLQPLAWELARAGNLLFGKENGEGHWVMDLRRIAAFSAAYRAIRPLTAEQVGDAVHRLWWSRLCDDFWHLERHYTQQNGSSDHLFLSACGLLSWWSDHRDEVSYAFTTA